MYEFSHIHFHPSPLWVYYVKSLPIVKSRSLSLSVNLARRLLRIARSKSLRPSVHYKADIGVREKFCWGGGGGGHRYTRWFFRDVKFSSPYRESTGIQNSANIFGKSRSTFLKSKTMKREIKRTHLSSKRSMKNDYFETQLNMSIILCMSFCIVLFAYFLSMLIKRRYC